MIEEILNKAIELHNEDFKIAETSNLSEVNNLSDEMSAIVCSATVFFINLKNMPYIIKNDGKRAASKTYKIFHEALSVFAKETNAYLIDHNSNSFLLVYASSIKEIDTHIENAYRLSYVLGKELVKSIPQFNSLNFAIGIDHGRVLGTKSNQGILWYGTCIDKAAAISELCLKPSYLGISGLIYSEISENLKTITRHILGIPKKEPAWVKGSYQFENERKHYYSSNHTIEVK